MPYAPITRFPSSPSIIRVPFFLLFGFNKGTPKKKGKRVLLGNLDNIELPGFKGNSRGPGFCCSRPNSSCSSTLGCLRQSPTDGIERNNTEDDETVTVTSSKPAEPHQVEDQDENENKEEDGKQDVDTDSWW